MATMENLEKQIYDALLSFNQTACWDVLRFAQQRQYLAEHLTRELDAQDAVRPAVRAKVLDEQVPGERETIGEAAQMYRSLRPVIEATMTEPDRWDGDDDEGTILGRYVQWLAAEHTAARVEELCNAADEPGHLANRIEKKAEPGTVRGTQ